MTCSYPSLLMVTDRYTRQLICIEIKKILFSIEEKPLLTVTILYPRSKNDNKFGNRCTRRINLTKETLSRSAITYSLFHRGTCCRGTCSYLNRNGIIYGPIIYFCRYMNLGFPYAFPRIPRETIALLSVFLTVKSNQFQMIFEIF